MIDEWLAGWVDGVMDLCPLHRGLHRGLHLGDPGAGDGWTLEWMPLKSINIQFSWGGIDLEDERKQRKWNSRFLTTPLN